MRLLKTFISVLLFNFLFYCCQYQKSDKNDNWIFVSMPDFLNVDCDYPQKGWEDALSFILETVKSENPDFLVGTPNELLELLI